METKKLAEIGTVVTGKTPSTSRRDYYDGDIPFVTPNELHAGRTVGQSAKTLSEAGLQSIKGSILEGTSVLVGCIGWDMGNVAMTNDRCASNQQINAVTSIISEVNPEYLYYWLSTKKDYLLSIASVTRTPILSKSTFEQVKVPVPSRDVQDGIARILASIDDQIATNDQVNDNLQAMALSQFMHQFFRKDPNGELSDVLIELPKSQVQVRDAKDIAGRYPFFTSGASVLRWDEPLAGGRNLLLNTGGNADVKFYVGDMAYSTDTWAVTARDGLADYAYLLLQAISPELDQKYFLGTGLRHLQKPLLKKRPIYIPSVSELRAFNAIVVPAMTMISENLRENRRLQELRDWLLPMLMNGQATVASSDKLSFT